MILCNSTQMREMDRIAIEDRGIPGTDLMLKAAGHIAEAALERISPGGRAAVFCGTGNNGGDGIGAAAFLMEKGVPVRVFLLGSEEKLTGDSNEMLKRLLALSGSIEPYIESIELVDCIGKCDVIIDAMFGIGLNSDLRGDALAATDMINSSGACVIAADIPSGVHADTGAILGGAVAADITVTFSQAKPGHFIEPGCTRCGEVRVRDIGIPHDLMEAAHLPSPEPCPLSPVPSKTFAVMPEDIKLPRRRPDSHKGDYGRCLIIAGSVGYTGAPAMCARAASRMGAGLVFLGVPEPVYTIMAVKLDEEMPFPLPDDGEGKLTADAGNELLRRCAECDAVVIGPGLGRSPGITELVTFLLHNVKTPVVLDADGLNAIAGNIDILEKAACPLILTPHLGEFARLGGDLSGKDRLSAARDFAMSHNCVLVLKGHRTITALPDGTAYINTTGNPAMAKGGSGDVLSGMIAALVGQKFQGWEAALTAVYLHGLAGDICAAQYGEYSVSAGDMTAMLPKAIKQLRNDS